MDGERASPRNRNFFMKTCYVTSLNFLWVRSFFLFRFSPLEKALYLDL